MLRRLLYIALDFPPLNSSGTYRNAKFVKYLGRFGWQPVVVTLDWHQAQTDDPLDETLLKEIPTDIPIIRYPPYHPLIALPRWLARKRPEPLLPAEARLRAEVSSDERPRSRFYTAARSVYHAALAPVGDMFFYWSLRALPRCIEVAVQHRVEAIYVSVSPWTLGILGVLLQGALRVPLIVDFRDYWTMWAVKQTRPFRDWLDASVERWVLRHADRIICVHQAMADDFQRLEPRCRGKCRVITNGYDEDDFRHVQRHTSPLDNHNEPRAHHRVVQLTHTGIAWGDAAQPLLDALSQLRRQSARLNLQVNFIGGLPPSKWQFIHEHQLDGFVHVEKRISHHDAIQQMLAADVLLLLLVGNEGGRKWYPGKLFEYLYAGRPVLAVAPEGIASELLRQAGVGLVVEPQDIDRLVSVLADIATDVDHFRHTYYRPDQRFIEQFNRVRLTHALACVLEEVTGGKQRYG
ncbi:MAG: glycosyltransferase [Acidobacteriota bacterium]|nr:glycosyltransferase [Acidobacteriota bacterium]